MNTSTGFMLYYINMYVYIIVYRYSSVSVRYISHRLLSVCIYLFKDADNVKADYVRYIER